MTEFIAADWMPENTLAMVTPGVLVEVFDTCGRKVGEFWKRQPSVVIVKNIGVKP